MKVTKKIKSMQMFKSPVNSAIQVELRQFILHLSVLLLQLSIPSNANYAVPRLNYL